MAALVGMNALKTRKNAIVEYLNYQIPVTQITNFKINMPSCMFFGARICSRLLCYYEEAVAVQRGLSNQISILGTFEST